MKHVHKQPLLTSVSECTLCQSRENKLEMFRQALVLVAKELKETSISQIEGSPDSRWIPSMLRVKHMDLAGILAEDTECPV